MFLHELAAAIQAKGLAQTAANTKFVNALGADAVGRRVASWLARLPVDCMAVARAIAVLGGEAALRVVAEVAELPLPAALAASESLERSDALGREGEAHDLAQDTLELARRWAAPRALGRALRVEGVLTGGEAGAEALREAVKILESAPAKLELAKALAALGAVERRLGREIAQELFVTPKTVEVHLSSCYRKLGVARHDQLLHALNA